MWLIRYRTLFVTLILGMSIAWSAPSQSCDAPVIFNSTGTTDTSAHLFWLVFSDPEVGFELTIVPEGQGPDSGEIVFLTPDQRMFSEEGLEPNTSYRAFIRSICQLDTSRWVNHAFLTDIRNQRDCLTNRPIPDDGCDNAHLEVSIHVPPSDSGSLGVDVRLSRVNLIVKHSYPADLRMELLNPRGVSATLVEHHGTIFDNFGEPGDTSCTQRTVFQRGACTSIYNAIPPFIGTFKPDMSLDILNDGGSPAGEWVLRICDRAPDDVGELEHISLEFEYGACPEPPSFELLRQPDETASFYHSPVQADSLRFGYRAGLGEPESPFDSSFVWKEILPGDSLSLITGLEFQTHYEYYSYIYCDGEWIGPSCSRQMNTFCGSISGYERWENQDTCEADCFNACEFESDIWRIPSTSANWTIRIGQGPYPFTGPNAGPFPKSDLPYLVSSGQNLNCDNGWNQLRSVCLEKTGSSCGFGFYYHQFGAQVGEFMILASGDEWASFDTIYIGEPSLESVWQYVSVDLGELPEGSFQLEFRVQNPVGPFSEIAIGDFFYSGMAPISLSDQITFLDSDRDGYGDLNHAVFYCGADLPDSLSRLGSDCDDADPAINPGVQDQFCSGRDENCDGQENIGMADPLVIDSIRITPSSCPNTNDGSIAIEVSGGITPYQVIWNTGGDSLQLDSLSSGMYSVSLVDSGSCQSLEKDILLPPVNPVAFSFLIHQNPNCLMPNIGEVEVLLSGGTPPYHIEWSNGSQSATNDSMRAGPFSVAVRDDNNCVFESEEQRLSLSDAYSVLIDEIKPIQCPDGGDGRISARAQGAIPPLSYQWSTGDTSKSLQDVASGWYQVLITDSTQCSVSSDSVFISSPSPMLLDEVQIQPQRCVGIADGKISISVKGGTPPYSYEWITPEGETRTQKNLENLRPGLYFLTITDHNGCQFTPDAIEVDSAIGFELLDVIIDSSSCPASPDGEIAILLEGNLPSLDLKWSDDGDNRLMRNDLKPGFYNLTITNSLECKRKLGPFEIPAGNGKLDIEIQAEDTIECFSNNPQHMVARIQDGKFPIEYHWSAGRRVVRQKLSDSLQILSPGSYRVTVTDGYGCVGESPEIDIEGRAPIQLDSLWILPPDCPTYENGRIFVRGQSPTSPLRYSWSSGRNGNQLSNLSAGSYGLTIEDESRCLPYTSDIQVPGPMPFRVVVDTFLESQFVCFEVDVSGGYSPYDILWNDRQDSDSPICFPKEGEAVNLYVEDANDCVLDTLVWDLLSSKPGVKASSQKVQVYPNPATNRVMIKSNFAQSVNFSIYDITGKLMKTGIMSSSNYEVDVSMFSAGIYVLKIKKHEEPIEIIRLIIY
jgi:hypothetical protein